MTEPSVEAEEQPREHRRSVHFDPNIPFPRPEEVNTKKPKDKSIVEAYLLWFPPLGLIGLHHFYLRRYAWGAIYFFTLGLLAIGWMFDFFRMYYLVYITNKQAKRKSQDHRFKRDITDSYALTLCPITGLLGAQHYYTGRWRFGLLYTCTLGLLTFGWAVDFLRIGCITARVNRKQTEYQMKKKRLDDAYVCLIPLGFTGLHQFYLERWLWGFLYLFTVGLFGIGWLSDFIRLPHLVHLHNKKLKAEIRKKSITDNLELGYIPKQENGVENETVSTSDEVSTETTTTTTNTVEVASPSKDSKPLHSILRSKSIDAGHPSGAPQTSQQASQPSYSHNPSDMAVPPTPEGSAPVSYPVPGAYFVPLENPPSYEDATASDSHDNSSIEQTEGGLQDSNPSMDTEEAPPVDKKGLDLPLDDEAL